MQGAKRRDLAGSRLNAAQLAVGALVWLVWPVMEQSRGATDAERRDLAGSRLNAAATGGWNVDAAGLLLQLAVGALVLLVCCRN